MAVDYSVLLHRLGRIFMMARHVRTFQGTTLRDEFEDVMAKYSDATRDQCANLTSKIEARQEQAGAIVHDLMSDARKTLITMFDDDATLEELTTTRALDALVRRLVAASQTVDRPSSGYVTLPTSNKGTAGSANTGNGILLLSDMATLGYLTTTQALDLPSIKTETIRAKCIRDATSQSVQSGNELFQIDGARATNRMSYEWPKGSGTKGSLTATRPEGTGGRAAGVNAVNNGSFEHFTSNAPDKWTIAAGSAGTTIDDDTDPHRGTKNLKFIGNGLVNPNITQATNSTLGTPGRINPDRPYVITAAVKYETAVPSVSLIISVRTSGGTILHDSIAGRAMQLTVTSASLTTSYQIFSAVVYSPIDAPKDSVIDIRFSSNQANTSVVHVDSVIVSEMRRFKKGGLAYAMIPGAADFVVNDEFTAAITNNCANGDGEIAREFDRFFDTETTGIVLPSATSPTLADATFIAD